MDFYKKNEDFLLKLENLEISDQSKLKKENKSTNEFQIFPSIIDLKKYFPSQINHITSCSLDNESDLIAILSENIIFFFLSVNEKFKLLRKFAVKMINDKKERTIKENVCGQFGILLTFINKAPSMDFIYACGSNSGLIYLINIDKNFKVDELNGHFNSIVDLKIFPSYKRGYWNLMLSASKDTFTILWNYHKKEKIAIFRFMFLLLFFFILI